jgi:hypothetical protein
MSGHQVPSPEPRPQPPPGWFAILLWAVVIRRDRARRPGHLGRLPHPPGALVSEQHFRRSDRHALERALDVVAHIPGRLIAVPGILGHGLEHDRVRPLRNLGVHPRGRDRVLSYMLVGDRHRRVAGERRPAGEQLVEQAAGGVQVAAGVHPLAPGLLRREILRGADDLRRRGLRHRGIPVADRPGDAEVHDLDVAGPGQHHVAGPDVPVHDPVEMAVAQRAQHPVGDLERSLRQQPSVVPQQVTEGPAVDVLHHDVAHRGVADHSLATVVDVNDRRMIKRCRRHRLAAEPGLQHLVARQVNAKHLHRDDAVHTDVAGAVDLGHAAASDDPIELVAAVEQLWLSGVSHMPKQ